MPHLEPWQWAIGALCAFLAGVSKTGVPGLATLISPLMVLMVGDAKLTAGWILPILCFADIFAVAYWRRHAPMSRVLALAPSSLAGMALGGVVLGLSEHSLRPLIGIIIILMLGIHLLRRLRPDLLLMPDHPAPYGVAAGFATTVANAAGPVMSLYLLSKRLTKEEFLAIGAWFFFFINLAKIPVYAWHSLFSTGSLRFDVTVAPVVAAGALAGKWIVSHIPMSVFEGAVVAFTVVATVLLFL